MMSKFPSVMKHSFSQVPQANIPRSSFNRNHGLKTTLDAGYLVPIFVDEALPGDTFNLKPHLFGRLATPIVPFMDNLYLDTFFFSVPYRLVWDNWQKFNGEQENPGDSTDYLIPTVPVGPTDLTAGKLSDYFGLPNTVVWSTGYTVNSLPYRAYNLIWNEWFRDQNLQDSVPVPKGDGPDNMVDFTLLRRGKRHDYFTSCLPWPQKGPSVTIPLQDNAVIERKSNAAQALWFKNNSNTVAAQPAAATFANGGIGTVISDSAVGVSMDPNGGLILPSENIAGTINQLRQSFQIQKLYERDARGGTRYTEIVRAHFGVISPDARLQRPEYLGGGSQRVMVNPVAQTSSTDGTTPQGNLAAMGTVAHNGNGFTHSFTEHCLVIGLVSIRADLNYQQGLNRMWTRQTRWDFYWPALSHIGEQAVLNKEIYTMGDSSDEEVFGYQERYAEYRYKPSLITGKFRSSDPQSLDIWHLAQDFTSRPVLNASFIQENPPVDRVIATPSEPHLLLDCYFEYKCARPMPVYSIPGLVDHF